MTQAGTERRQSNQIVAADQKQDEIQLSSIETTSHKLKHQHSVFYLLYL